MSGKRKRDGLAEGLAQGLKEADVAGMAGALGEGLVRVSEAWLPGQKLAVPQPCPVRECVSGPYSSLNHLRRHLCATHSGLTNRERSFVLDQARRAAVRQAMNGAARSQ